MVRHLKLLSIFMLVLGSIAFGILLAEGVDLGRSTPQSGAAPAATALAAGTDWSPPGSFADIVDRVNDSVVFVQVTEVGKRSAMPHPPLGPEGRDFFDYFRQPDQQRDDEFRREGGGSGFIVDADGWILTNNHVIEGATKVTVKLDDDRQFEAEVRGTDALLDVALIKIDGAGALPTVPLGDSDALRVGDWVLAIGNPFIYEHTVTAGVVSHKGRATGNPFQRFIQTDAAINFGNSGGPLLNTRGEVVGISTAISAIGQNIGFAIPINMVKTIMPDLKEKGRVARGFLGVNPQEIDEKLKGAFPGLPSTKGALVVDVEPDSPASTAGMQVDDVIVEFDGKPVKNRQDLFSIVGSTPPGAAVGVKVLRETKKGSGKWGEVALKATLVERQDETAGASEGDENPHAPSVEPSGERLGIEVEEISPHARQALDLPARVQGVVVVRVSASGPAADAGLSQGDVITEVNGRPVSGAASLGRELSGVGAGDRVRLRVYHQGAPRYVVVEISK